MLKLLE